MFYMEESYIRQHADDSLFVLRLQKEAGAKVFEDTTINANHLNVPEVDDYIF